MASQHLFQVSSTHIRNRALCAAEAGVYAARYQLEKNILFQGKVSGTLPQDDAHYSVDVSRDGALAELHAVGKCGSAIRRVHVKLSLDPDSFNALGTDGKVRVDKHSYINGVRSLVDPRSAKGNIHSNSSAPDALVVDGNLSRLSVTGTASALGGMQGNIDGRRANQGTISSLLFSKDELLAGSFTGTNIPSDGKVLENTTIPGKLEMDVALHIPKGRTVHVQGDVILRQGLTGGGTLVVDGKVLVRGSSGLDSQNAAGVLLYADGDVVIANSAATFDGAKWNTPEDPVGSLFAEMPDDIPYILAQRLPLGAPDGPEFFSWYEKARKSPTPSFNQWLKGDGTELNPGISDEAKAWLDEVGPMASQLVKK